MPDFWPSCGYCELQRNAQGWLLPTDAFWRLYLSRPELALVPESCAAERRLHEALMASPGRAVSPAELAAVQDADARENHALFLRFRDAVLAAGTLQAWYLALVRSAVVDVPPLFVDLIVQAMLRAMLDGVTDPLELRAAELMYRPQRVSVHEGRVLAGDAAVLDLLNETAGLGDLGRLLVQSRAPVAAVQLQVMAASGDESYWAASERHVHLLDLTHDQGLLRPGLHALARVLEKWIDHLLGVMVSIRPLQEVRDASWRWHVGLDVESSAMLNALYQGEAVAPERLQRMLSLFRLEFANPREMSSDVAGKPVYLGLAMTADGRLRLKPQNLVLNLPLAGMV